MKTVIDRENFKVYAKMPDGGMILFAAVYSRKHLFRPRCFYVDICGNTLIDKDGLIEHTSKEKTFSVLLRYVGLTETGQNHKLDTDTQVFFYEQDFYVLSNFSAFSLNWKGHRFDTSEAAYHWEKFEGTNPRMQQKILVASSAHDAFKIAEANKNLRRPDWDDVKVDVMRDILRAKVDQHEYVRRKLLATGDRELIEDSWRDDFWGWGPNRDGQNMLGKLWMQIRAELRENGNG